MPLIPLSDGIHFATVDEEDFERLSQYRWRPDKGRKGCVYALRWLTRDGKRTVRHMHRDILDPDNSVNPRKLFVDHIDGDGLNNIRKNLRWATPAQSQFNQGKRKQNTTGYKGVSYVKKCRYFIAHISVNGRKVYKLGFQSAEEAAYAYNEMAKEYYGEFARLNVIEKAPEAPEWPMI
jgi:hypothetical protein